MLYIEDVCVCINLTKIFKFYSYLDFSKAVEKMGYLVQLAEYNRTNRFGLFM